MSTIRASIVICGCLAAATAWGDPPSDEAQVTPAAATPAKPTGPPTLSELSGTWFVTSRVDGKEAVDWGCTLAPDTVQFDEDFITLVIGGAINAGAVKAANARGDAMVATTVVGTCTSSKDVTVKWVDPGRTIAEITRCTGTPRTVRAVRNTAAGVDVLRQCCNDTGKLIRRVGVYDQCPGGTQGQKPVQLRP